MRARWVVSKTFPACACGSIIYYACGSTCSFRLPQSLLTSQAYSIPLFCPPYGRAARACRRLGVLWEDFFSTSLVGALRLLGSVGPWCFWRAFSRPGGVTLALKLLEFPEGFETVGFPDLSERCLFYDPGHVSADTHQPAGFLQREFLKEPAIKYEFLS